MTKARSRETTGTLTYSIGQRMIGRVCAADEALDQLSREIWKLTYGSMWGWFAERCRALETDLAEAGGFDEDLADRIESEFGYFGPTEEVERFDRTEAICADQEALVGAFFVAIQPRLNAVKLAAEHIYQVATSVDRLALADKKVTMPPTFEETWEVANYVKHNDEWRETLERRQQRSFEVLRRLGVATMFNEERQFVRWPLATAARSLSGEAALPQAVATIVSGCELACRQVIDAIQADFAPIAADVEAVRIANIPRLEIRPERRPPPENDS